jgi:hypothetical protein
MYAYFPSDQVMVYVLFRLLYQVDTLQGFESLISKDHLIHNWSSPPTQTQTLKPILSICHDTIIAKNLKTKPYNLQ